MKKRLFSAGLALAAASGLSMMVDSAMAGARLGGDQSVNKLDDFGDGAGHLTSMDNGLGISGTGSGSKQATADPDLGDVTVTSIDIDLGGDAGHIGT